MIEIIKPGKTGHKTATCPFCDCEFAYDESDLSSNVDFTIVQYHIWCPWCHSKIQINSYSIATIDVSGDKYKNV